MKPRNCGEVIKQMISEIPESEKPFIHALKVNIEDATYKAPEETIQWFRTSETLQKFIKNPNKEWQFKVLSIFTTKTIDELKNMTQ